MKLFRSGFIVASFTLLSRIFGLIRELFIANMFGTGAIADSVNVAFKLPNLFRRIFGEGALSTVFIPIFNEKLLISKKSAKEFTGEIFGLLLVVLILLVVLMQIFMPYLMFIIAPGFNQSTEKFELTILLCRLTMPYLIFISIAALFGGILNSLEKFAAFAFTPVILSISVILGTLLLEKKLSPAISISLSILIGGLVQVLFMFYCSKKAGFILPPRWHSKNEDVKKFIINMGPASLSAGVGQINLFISQSIASFIPGAVSILSYADRIYQFPLSIIGITFGTILLPELSKIYKINDIVQANLVQNKAIKIGLLLSLPAACGIIALSEPIIHIIYERGAFTSLDTIKTSTAISAFALGLPSFVLSKILTPIFYANGDTKTPLKITLFSLAVNTLLNVILMIPFDHVGIALGSSIAGWYNVWLLYSYAKKYKKINLYPSLKSFCLKVLFNCLIMTLVIILIKYFFFSYFYFGSTLVNILSLSFTVLIGMSIFLLLCSFFKLHRILLSE